MDFNNEYGTLSIQKELLDLVKLFHTFCKQHGISYSLAYGSLLGAVRHNGFIPWDDDLDIFVDRDNYFRLVSAIKEDNQLSIDRDSADALWVDRIHKKGFSLGNATCVPTLDVFVLDNVPNSFALNRIKYLLILALQGMMKQKPTIDKGSIILRVGSLFSFFLGRLIPMRVKSRLYRVVSQIGNNNKCERVANYNAEYNDLRKTYPSEILDSIVSFPFEDTCLDIVADFDNCLKVEYGDYMKIPDFHQRLPKHMQG